MRLLNSDWNRKPSCQLKIPVKSKILSSNTPGIDMVIMQSFFRLSDRIELLSLKKLLNLFLSISMVGIFFCSTTLPKNQERNTCLKGDCINGYGVQEFNRGFQKIARYEGTFKNGKYEGEGVYFFENKDKYTGTFIDDKISGKGVYEYFETGDVYKGEFKEEQMDGFGIYITKKGNRYEGNFKKGKLSGEGKLIRKDGEILIGNFKDDYPNGKAVIRNKSGKVIFDGEFLEK